MGCTACHEQHAASADRHRHWTRQNDYSPSQRNAEGSTPFFEITVLCALTVTQPAIFRKKTWASECDADDYFGSNWNKDREERKDIIGSSMC